MNGHPFLPRHGPIMVDAEVTGPARSMALQLVLDTGATTSLLSKAILTALGYDLASESNRIRMTTGREVTSAPRLILTRFQALGRLKIGFPVLAYSLPACASVYGLLGLDFLRDQVLTIDFRAGLFTLT